MRVKKLGGEKKKKMKTKILVLIGIAVCAILLTSSVLASADAARLHIYGDATEDDTLDMRDVTYIKLVIFGKKPATTLADANYDGKISMLDVGQTKLIILGKEKKLTLIDQVGRTVTVPKPVERVVPMIPSITRALVGLGLVDKIVGMDSSSHQYAYDVYPKAFPEEEIPNVGSVFDPNEELILGLKPDVIFAFAGNNDYLVVWNEFQEKTGIPVVGKTFEATYQQMFAEIEDTAIVVENEKEAEELILYLKEKLDKVTEVTSKIPDSEKPKVLSVGSHDITRVSAVYEPIDAAGGINVAGHLIQVPGPGGVDVSIEQIIAWNPDIFLIRRSSVTSKLTVEDVLSDSRLETINAVKNRKVYYAPGAFYLVGADVPRVIAETFLIAKLCHPDKFEDFDLEKEGNEVFERFYGVEGLWTEIGTELGFI